MMLQGGCYCGAVRYQVQGELSHATLCHCADCRRIAAAPAVAWFSVARAALQFTAGQPTMFRSSEHVTRRFCPRCGTGLTYQHEGAPDEVDITTCSLDDPAAVPPQDHTFASHRLGWLQLQPGLPEYPGTRTGAQNE